MLPNTANSSQLVVNQATIHKLRLPQSSLRTHTWHNNNTPLTSSSSNSNNSNHHPNSSSSRRQRLILLQRIRVDRHMCTTLMASTLIQMLLHGRNIMHKEEVIPKVLFTSSVFLVSRSLQEMR
jgi:hypothetical protein